MTDPQSDPLSDPLSDDAFAARLRQVTAEVPPSRLDLDAVLVSSRRRVRRRRAALGACCVAAVAAGAAAPTITTLLPDGQVTAALVAGRGTSGEGTARSTCDPADVDVTWRSESVSPVVARVERTTHDGAALTTEELVPFDRHASAPSVTGVGPVSPEIEEGVLREAAETEGSGVTFAERSGFALGGPAGAAHEPDALQGFSGADRTFVALYGSDVRENLEAGTYLFYAAGDEHRATGYAACGDGGRRFELSYWAVDETGTISCASPVEGNPIAVYLKRAYCDVPLSEHERAAIGLVLDDPSTVAGVDAVAARLRIGTPTSE